MKEFKGDKFPWKINKNAGQYLSIQSANGFPFEICKLGVDIPTTLANAKLIAAAPELLQACLAVLDGQTNKEIESAKRLAYVAINKALG